MNKGALLLTALLLSLSVHVSASAQSIIVRVTEDETGHPIYGAFVTLQDQEGRPLRSALTNMDGRFLFVLPSAGLYTISAQMMGRETQQTPQLRVEAGEAIVQDMALVVQAIQLETLAVEGSARCTLHPDEGEETAAIWEEARMALEVASWALREEMFQYQIDHRVREYGPDGRRIRSESNQVLSGFFREPFRSIPPGDLVEGGFIQTSDGDTIAYAPDATVLLSDQFLDTHCFRVRRGEEDDLVGLAFEPVSRRGPVDIQGVLWLDLRTQRLNSVDFQYTGYSSEGNEADAGGRVEFERLPSGAWIVRRWFIRLPMIGRVERHVPGGFVWEMAPVAYFEEGGEVVRIRDREGGLVASADRALLSGSVVDTTQGVPLPGARVFLSGTEWEDRTDSEGHFRILNLPEGVYAVGVSSPSLDSLGVEIAPVEVELEAGRMTWVDLSVPGVQPKEVPERAAVPEVVPPSQGGSSSPGRLTGRVVAWETGEPLEGVEISLPSAGTATATNGEGRFLFPVVAPGSHMIRAEILGRGVVEDMVSIDAEESLYVEFRLRVEPISLEGIVVEVESRYLKLELAGFFERRDRGQGVFFTQEQIHERNPVTVLDLFEGVPGARVIRSGLKRSVSLVGSRALSFGDPLKQPCYPAVWIDDQPHLSPGNTEPVFLDDLVRPFDIAGMEIYQSTARIPARYNLGGACGVVVIWTR